MRRWIRMAARLYPSRWRQRYGAEFDALLEDTRPTLKNTLDVAWGALEMHMNMLTFPKLAVLCGVTGAILAAVIAARVPDKYVSEAVIRVSADDPGLRFFRDRALPRALSPTSLSEVIRNDNIYLRDQQHVPVTDSIERMKQDIAITNENKRATRPNEFDFTVRYSSADAAQADITGNQLVFGIIRASFLESITAHPRMQVRLLSPPRLAAGLVRPNRPLITALGFAAGLVLASLLSKWRRRSCRRRKLSPHPT